MKFSHRNYKRNLIVLISVFFLINCKSSDHFKIKKLNLKKKDVSEVVFDMSRYGMGITASIKNNDSILDFLKELNHSKLKEFNKCCCNWDRIILKSNGEEYILKTNGEIFTTDSIIGFYKLNEKYVGYWDGYEKCR
ncbi:hypothetical protein OAC97_04135 [Flavobacteriaceae bacterium]|nr:hypothetical protein [Flavobacteriaceae bacterium]